MASMRMSLANIAAIAATGRRFRRAVIPPWLRGASAAGALLAIAMVGAGCGGAGTDGDGGAAGHMAGAASGGAAHKGAPAPNANDCASALPTDPAPLAAMLGLVEARLVMAGRKDADFGNAFGDASDQVFADADAREAQAVEAVADDRMIPLPDAPPTDPPAPATCGVTVAALTNGVGQEWESATFLATANLLLAVDGNTAAVSYPPVDNDLSLPGLTSHTRITTDVTVSLSGSHAVAIVSMSKTISATGTNGAALGSIAENATAMIDVDFCPDADGVVTGMITFSGNGTNSPGGKGTATSYHVQASGRYKIHVNDKAETDSVDLDGSLQFSATGGSSVDVEATFSGGYMANVTGTVMGTLQFQRADGSAADINTVDDAVYSTALLASMVAERTAKSKWRGGACVEVRADPDSTMVDANAQLTVTGTPIQKFEMAEIKAPVVATLEGVQSLDPVNKAVPSPAPFTYVAGSKWKDQGVVKLTSTSKRGIGKGSATYTVKCDDAMMMQCPSGQTWNPDSCKCECQTKSCGPHQVLNPFACQCLCDACPLGLKQDPDTCECSCEIDPMVGNPSPACHWVGTVHITSDDSAEGDQTGTETNLHWKWSLSYDASFSVITGSRSGTNSVNGTLTGSWQEEKVTSAPGSQCTVTTTEVDDTPMLVALNGFDTGSANVMATGDGTLQMQLAVPYSLKGTSTTRASCDSRGDATDAASFEIYTVVGVGTGSGSSFKGTDPNAQSDTSVDSDANFTSLPKVTMTWDVKLEPE